MTPVTHLVTHSFSGIYRGPISPHSLLDQIRRSSSRSKVGSVVGMVDCWPAQQPRSWSIDFVDVWGRRFNTFWLSCTCRQGCRGTKLYVGKWLGNPITVSMCSWVEVCVFWIYSCWRCRWWMMILDDTGWWWWWWWWWWMMMMDDGWWWWWWWWWRWWWWTSSEEVKHEPLLRMAVSFNWQFVNKVLVHLHLFSTCTFFCFSIPPQGRALLAPCGMYTSISFSP